MSAQEKRGYFGRLDELYPFRGPCAICGGPDARHRLWDALINLPESDDVTAWWFEVDIEMVRLVRELRPYRDGEDGEGS